MEAGSQCLLSSKPLQSQILPWFAHLEFPRSPLADIRCDKKASSESKACEKCMRCIISLLIHVFWNTPTKAFQWGCPPFIGQTRPNQNACTNSFHLICVHRGFPSFWNTIARVSQRGRSHADHKRARFELDHIYRFISVLFQANPPALTS